MKYVVDSDNLEEYTESKSEIMTGSILPKGHFTWEELQAEVPDSFYSQEDAKKNLREIYMQAFILEMYRLWYKKPIEVTHWFRPDAYTQNLIDRGYPAATGSDHLYCRAIDSNVPVTANNIAKWKEICNACGVYWSIGLYSWGMHLGFRYDENRTWDLR